VSETDEIAAWLRAQAVADIGVAGTATPGPWKDDGSPACMVFQPAGTRGVAWCSNGRHGEDLANSAHIARHDPLTEATRAWSVLAVLDDRDRTAAIAGPVECPQGEAAARDYLDARRELAVLDQVVRLLAHGYQHRKGFKERWRP
jgi:hypothetical protein